MNFITQEFHINFNYFCARLISVGALRIVRHLLERLENPIAAYRSNTHSAQSTSLTMFHSKNELRTSGHLLHAGCAPCPTMCGGEFR